MAKTNPPLTRKDAKNALMAHALVQARNGLSVNFNDVVRALEARGLDAFTLRLYAKAADRDRIDIACRQSREFRFPKGKS